MDFRYNSKEKLKYVSLKIAQIEMLSLGKSEKTFQIKKFLQYNCLFFRIICSELLRTFTKETFLFEIFFHFSPIKTFPFGLILMGHISVFQVNDPKSMNFFYNFNIFRISCEQVHLPISSSSLQLDSVSYFCTFSMNFDKSKASETKALQTFLKWVWASLATAK